MGLEVGFAELIGVAAAVITPLATAVGVLFRWCMEQFTEVKQAHSQTIEVLRDCETKHQLASERQAYLEGQIEEIQRLDPTEFATAVSKAVVNAINAGDHSSDR